VLRVGALREVYGVAITEAAQAHHEARVREARALRRELKLMRAAYEVETPALVDRLVGATPTHGAKRKRSDCEFVQLVDKAAATVDAMQKQAADALAKIPRLTPEIIRATFELDEDA
jgi:predicted RNA methylase